MKPTGTAITIYLLRRLQAMRYVRLKDLFFIDVRQKVVNIGVIWS